ncbi:hypothetical protein [Lentzea sp. CA-135723]|uniref:hypothetical protein n=1 Tax=Lentzea sp. CA-135723 TaxID=3239950 RepID=UPI003D8ED5F7
MFRTFATAAALVAATVTLATPAALAAGPGQGSGAPGTTQPVQANPPKNTTPYYYAWYPTAASADSVGKAMRSQGKWRQYAIQTVRSGPNVYFYLWFGL